MKNRTQNKKNIKHAINISIATICALVCVACFIVQVPASLKDNNVAIATAAMSLTMPQGSSIALQEARTENNNLSDETEVTQTDNSNEIQTTNNNNAVIINTHTDVEGVEATAIPRSTPIEGESTYAINERQIGTEGSDVVNNVAVKNTTGVDIDVESELDKQPDVHITKNTPQPQVILYHTHTTESYMMTEESCYPANFYPRTTDLDYSVVAVGNEIAKQLQAAGISVVHDTTIHDNPSYVGAYSRSEATVENLLTEYPSATVTIDIHRDAIGNDEAGKSKPTCTIDGEKAAQIMIVSGCDPDGSVGIPDWEYNLRLALRLQEATENTYPGLARPLQFCNSRYNMDMTHGSLLVEVGGDVNTIDEAKRSGQCFGNVLAGVLTSLAQ